MSKLIARAKIIDEATGEEVPVDVRTCAEAVTCAEGKTVQQHIKSLSDHMADEAAHPTAVKRLEWDSKETTDGAQSKADKAKDAAITAAQTIATNAKNEAIFAANKYAENKAENAKNDAIRAAASDATSKIEALQITTERIPDEAVTNPKIANNAITMGKIAKNAVTTEKIINGAITFEKLAANAIPADRVIKRGTSGNWTYRCWASGKVEAWGKISVAATLSAAFSFTTSDGSRSLLKTVIGSQTIPSAIVFPNTPKIFYTVEAGSAVWCGINKEATGTNATPELTVYSWSIGTDISTTIAVNYYCVSQ